MVYHGNCWLVAHRRRCRMRSLPTRRSLGPAGVITLLLDDFGAVTQAAGSVLIDFGHDNEKWRVLEGNLTKLLGEDNLIGSCGEFGLLFAFLGHAPRRRR
jgi:hypothetical protein